MTTFEHDGKRYELKMTRAGVRVAEAQGLSSSQIAEKPFSALALLFFASLYSAYKVNPNKATAILDDLLESGDLEFESLFSELSEAYVDLFGLGESK
jgi:hypothetical protein